MESKTLANTFVNPQISLPILNIKYNHNISKSKTTISAAWISEGLGGNARMEGRTVNPNVNVLNQVNQYNAPFVFCACMRLCLPASEVTGCPQNACLPSSCGIGSRRTLALRRNSALSRSGTVRMRRHNIRQW